jgi:hypothetical protein
MMRQLDIIPRYGKFFPVVMAVILFLLLFIGRGLGPLDFWWSMSLVIIFCILCCIAVDGSFLMFLADDLKQGLFKKILLGFFTAAILYGIFFIGNYVSRMIIPFAASGIESVYAFKSDTSIFRITLLMLFVIGPGEEIFWRGYVHRALTQKLGPLKGLTAAVLLYTAVHIGSLNPMLVIAAAVCGAFWGYMFLKSGSVAINIVSHTLWDMLVFIIIPF